MKLSSIQKKLEKLTELVSKEANERRAKYSAKSATWQDSDKGEKASQEISQLEDATDLLNEAWDYFTEVED